MSTIYLHVGPHKTGSTYLQTLWEQSFKELKKHNLVYPKVFYMAKGQHHLVTHIRQNIRGKSFQSGISLLNSIKSDIIISSENFSILTKKELEELRELFKNKDIQVIYYFRNPTQRFISKWQETIKHGATESFFEYYTKHSIKPLKSNELNPLLFLQDLSEVFGKNNLHIIDYQQAYSNKSMMKEFGKVINKIDVISDIDIIVNEMADLMDIEIMRLLNYKAMVDGSLHGSNIREVFYMLLRNEKINISGVKEKMSKYITSMVCGDTLIDRHVYLKLRQQYSTNFVNALSLNKNKSYKLINDRFMMDQTIISEVNNIYDVILEYINK